MNTKIFKEGDKVKNCVCCIAGHAKINDNSLKDKIKTAAVLHIEKYGVTEFWVGNYGDFGRYSASVIGELKKDFPQIRLVLVIPYLTREIIENKNSYYRHFDSIVEPDFQPTLPYKYRIIMTNRFMVDNSDYLICYIKYSWGGAAKTLDYAIKNKELSIYNLAGCY